MSKDYIDTAPNLWAKYELSSYDNEYKGTLMHWIVCLWFERHPIEQALYLKHLVDMREWRKDMSKPLPHLVFGYYDALSAALKELPIPKEEV